MTAGAIMSVNPVTLRDSDSVAAAAKALGEHRQIGLPVVDGQGRFVGMFGLNDLLSLLVPRVALAGDLLPNLRFLGEDVSRLKETYRQVKDKPMREVCDRQAVTLRPDTPLMETVRLFCKSHTTLAVVEARSGRLAGLVSYRDLLAALTGGAA
jgi:CBS-domain-containing membrane protein